MSPLLQPSRISRLGGIAVAAILTAAIAFVTVQLARPAAHSASTGAIKGPAPATLARPLAAPAKQMSMAAASSALGVSVPLPNTAVVKPDDVGAVWEGSWTYGTSTTMALTYPSQGLIIYYHRPAPVVADQTKMYQQQAAENQPAEVVELNGTTPALVLPQNSDDTGVNFGCVMFVVNGTDVQVRGHNDNATLQAIAESILTLWPSNSSSTPPGTSSSPQG